MFLPLFVTSKGINLIVYETWDKPVRYFDSHDDEHLKPILEYFSGPLSIKSIDPLKVLESKLIPVRYVVKVVKHESLVDIVNTVDQCALLTFSSIDTLYESSLPEELILGIARVVSNEL